MALSSPTFIGSGLNDLSGGGSYTGNTPAIFTVEIVTAGSPDTFRWKKDAGAWSAPLQMTTAAYTMSDGITITFAAATGHTAGSSWSLSTGGQAVWPQIYKDFRHGNNAPHPLQIIGDQRFSAVLQASGADAVGNDIIVHSQETGTYDTIEGEAIVTKVMTREILFALTLHDTYQYTLTCLDSHTGAIEWDYEEDFALYSAHDCTLYSINMTVHNEMVCVFGLLEARSDDEIKHAPFFLHRYGLDGSRVDASSADLLEAPEGYPVLYDMYCNTQAAVKDGKAYLQVVSQHIGSTDDALAAGASKSLASWSTNGLQHATAATVESNFPLGQPMANFAGQTSTNITGTLSSPQQKRTIKGRELIVYSSGYDVYCMDATSGIMKWKHAISGVQAVEVPPYSQFGTGAEDVTRQFQHNGSSPDSFVMGDKHIVVLVSKLDYDIHSNFYYDFGAGEEEIPNYPSYNSVKHYLYFLDYEGNYRGETLLREECFASFGEVADTGGWVRELGYRGNDLSDIPDTFNTHPLAEVVTFDPRHQDINLPPYTYGYCDDNGVWIPVSHYEAWYKYYREASGSLRSINNGHSTRSQFSDMIARTEGGIEYVYITRRGTDVVSWEGFDASDPVHPACQDYTYKVRCSDRSIVSTTAVGAVNNNPLYDTIAAPPSPMVWPENTSDPENPYTLTLERNSTGFKIVNGGTSVSYSHDLYDPVACVRIDVNNYNDFLWLQKKVGGTWKIGIAQIAPDCTIVEGDEWISAVTGPGTSSYSSDARDRLISGTTYSVLMLAVSSTWWKSLKFNIDTGLESIFSLVITHSTTNFKTDGTFSYFWDTAGDKVYQCKNADGSQVAELSVDSKEWRSNFAILRTKVVNMAKEGGTITVQAIDKHGGQYRNNLIAYDLGTPGGVCYHTDQSAFVPGELVLTDELIIMMVEDTITAYDYSGVSQWTDATGVFVMGCSYAVGEDEYIYLLMDDLTSVRKYSIGGTLLDTLTLPYALSSPGALCLYEWQTEVPEVKVPVLLFVGNTWMISIADGHNSTDVNWSSTISYPVQGAMWDTSYGLNDLYYQGGGVVEGKHCDNTTGFTYTDLDDMQMQGAPSAGDLYLYAYGLEDISGEARLIALASGMSYMDVASVTPLHEAVDVSRSIKPSITFTQQPLLSTITSSTVALTKTDDSSAVPYTVETCAARVLTINPDEKLEAETGYTLTLSTGITALEDTALHEEHVYTFTTGIDDEYIEVTSTSPANGATNVAYTTDTITATFDDDLDADTLAGQVTLDPSLDFSASASGAVLTITLTGTGMDSDTEYTVTLGTGIESHDAKSLEEAYVFSFTTAAQSFPPDPNDPEEWQYEIGEVYIEGPDTAYAEEVEVIIRAPRITSTSGKHLPKWRLHFTVESYYEVNTGTEETPVWERVLIESVSSETAPASFSYSADQGVTWRSFPVDGLPPEQYESKVKCMEKVGRYASVILVPSFGAEPA
jgi:hypothetical protein